MSSSFGEKIKVSVFGESHGEAIGVLIDSLPPGEDVDKSFIAEFMKRRAPGRNEFSTKRKEADKVHFLSGVYKGKTTGTPFCAIIENTDKKSSDYENLQFVPRPGHGDYTGFLRYEGFADPRGGGHFSGRLTAPLCVAGAICKKALERRGIYVGGHIYSIGDIYDRPFNYVELNSEELLSPGKREFPVLDEDKGLKMQKKIRLAASEFDSVGGIIEVCAISFPAGIGSPMFGGLENRIALGLFGIPAVKGVEFGAGFKSSLLKGSENNDPFYMKGDEVKTKTNNHGGILGGISSGMPIVVRLAIKPTPSIFKEQESIELFSGEGRTLSIKGRHDPCIVQRAVPVAESVLAIVLFDMLVERGMF